MFTTDKTEAELRHAFGKQTIEDVESVVFLSLRALTMHANNIAETPPVKGEVANLDTTLRLQLQLQTVRAGIARVQDVGAWLALMPGERDLPQEDKALAKALEKAEATVARLAAKVGVAEAGDD